MLLFPKPICFVFFMGVFLPALICVHVQAELRAQVEVEKRVDAEDEEQDRHDDQEGVLKKTEHVTLYHSPVLLRSPHTQERLRFVWNNYWVSSSENLWRFSTFARSLGRFRVN